MPSKSPTPDDSILDLIQRVGDEATKLTLARLGKQEPEPPKELTPDELALTYGLEPTTIENLKATQPKWEKLLGRKVSLEEVYFLEFDQAEQGKREDS